MDTFFEIQKEIAGFKENLKAEILVKEIEEATQLNFDNFLILALGAFNRAYTNDVASVSKIKSFYEQEVLKLNLSRNGLYDKLPEGLFHEDIQENSNFKYSKIKQLQKEEEMAARLFFAPLENELFYQRKSLYEHEEFILKEFENLNDNFLLDLWKIEEDIPPSYAKKFIEILPQIHKIVGDLEQTFRYLEYILEAKVTYFKTFKIQNINKMDETPSNNNQLGVDFTLHQDYSKEEFPFLHITIHPSDKRSIKDYIGEHGLKKVINAFMSYFLPLDYEFTIEITYRSPNDFVLEKNVGCYMGVDTIL